MNVPATTAKRPETFGDLTRDLLKWLSQNSLEAARSAFMGAALGYGCNLVLMAVVYDGFRKTSGGFVTGQNSLIDGTLLWTIASTVIFTLYGYRKSVGKERFNKILREFPAKLGQLVEKDGEQSRSHLCWGAGVTFLTSEFVSPALGATVAVTMAISAPSLIGRFVTGMLLRAWSTIMSKLAPGKKNPIDTAMSMTVAILGSCAAFLVAFFVKDAAAKFVFALLCLFFASRAGKGPTPSAKVMIMVFSALALRDAVAPWVALADDGGYWENGGGLIPWLSKGGLTDLAGWSVPGGIAGGVGGAIGSAIGNVLGTYPEDEGAKEQPEEEESGAELPPEVQEESEADLPPEGEEESEADLPPEGEEESEADLPPESEEESEADLPPEGEEESEADLPPEGEEESEADLPPEGQEESEADLPPEREEESEADLPPEGEEESEADLPPEGEEESEADLPPEGEEESEADLPPEGEEESEADLPPEGEEEESEADLPPQEETEFPPEEQAGLPQNEEKTEADLPPQGETELPPEEQAGLPPNEEKTEADLPPQGETELPPEEQAGLPPNEEKTEADLPPQVKTEQPPEEQAGLPPESEGKTEAGLSPQGDAKAPPEGKPTEAATKEDMKTEGQAPEKQGTTKGSKDGEGKDAPSSADQKLTPEQEQDRRQKYKDLVAKVTSLEAEDSYHLLSSLKKAANIKDGVPTGNLDQMEKAVNARLNIKPPEGFVSSVVQQTKDFGAGVVQDAKEIGTAVTETAAAGYNAVKDAVNDVRKDPSIITQTLSNARDQLTELGQKAVEKTAEAAAEVKDAITDVVKHPEIITETIKGSAQQVSDAVSGTVKDAVDTVKEVAQNPQIISDTLKDTVNDLQDVNKVIKVIPGGQKLIDATDPNRPAVDRLKDGLIGATEFVGTIDAVHGLAGLAQAGKGKVLEIIGKGLGKESAEAAAKSGAGLVDDAAKATIAKTGGKDALETTITKSGARTAGEATEASAAKAGGGIADDAAKAATPTSKADDALAAGRRKPPEPGSKVSPEPGRKAAPEPTASRPIEPKDPNYEQVNLTKEEMNKAMAGMPEQNIKHAQVVADKYGVKIQVRPTNPEAKALLESGQAVPKPQFVKMKTITPEDIALGAPEGSTGKVGYFKPNEPLGVPKDSPLYKRYQQRLSEYHDQSEHVSDLIKGDKHLKPGENQIFVKDGIVHDAKTGKPFTGDHDLFDIKGLHGEELPSAVRDQVYKELNRGPFKAQHPEHMGWDYSKLSKKAPPPVIDPVSGELVQPQSPFEIAEGIDKKILDSHRPGGKEPLITFTGGEGPSGMPLPNARDRAGASVFTGTERPVRLSPAEQYQQSALQRMGLKPEQIKGMKPEQIENLMDSQLSGLRNKYKPLS